MDEFLKNEMAKNRQLSENAWHEWHDWFIVFLCLWKSLQTMSTKNYEALWNKNNNSIHTQRLQCKKQVPLKINILVLGGLRTINEV